MLMEIQGQKTVSGCKNSFLTFYIAVMRYGVWLLILCAEHGTNLTGASPVTGIYRQV